MANKRKEEWFRPHSSSAFVFAFAENSSSPQLLLHPNPAERVVFPPRLAIFSNKFSDRNLYLYCKEKQWEREAKVQKARERGEDEKRGRTIEGSEGGIVDKAEAKKTHFLRRQIPPVKYPPRWNIRSIESHSRQLGRQVRIKRSSASRQVQIVSGDRFLEKKNARQIYKCCFALLIVTTVGLSSQFKLFDKFVFIKLCVPRRLSHTKGTVQSKHL